VTTPNKISTPRRGQKKVYIRYLPDPLMTKNKKIIIKKIMGLPAENFVGEKDDIITLKKLILVSKIVVIEDIQKDW
jgi:hypothetical protein